MNIINKNIAKFGDFEVNFKSEILSYIEMKDRIIFLLNWFKKDFDESGKHPVEAKKEDVERRNIFCYSTKTGNLLWQVDSNVDDSSFCGIDVSINKGEEDSEWYICDTDDREVVVKNFDLDKDSLVAGLLNGWHYSLDPKTGKTKFLYQGK